MQFIHRWAFSKQLPEKYYGTFAQTQEVKSERGRKGRQREGWSERKIEREREKKGRDGKGAAEGWRGTSRGASERKTEHSGAQRM